MQIPGQTRRSVVPLGALASVLAFGILAASCSGSTSTAATSTPGGGAAAANSDQGVKVVNDAKFGAILETSTGMPLYTYDKDTTGKSNCTGSCLTEWPALAATGGSAPSVSGASGTFTLVKRDDGTMQVAYNGMPLYTFVDDKAGQVTGDGQDGFHAAKSTASAAPATPAASGSNGGYNY
jgi:predicted lipoprotein with Yx(FWY)xxD motif